MVDATQREKLNSLAKKLDFVHKDKETTRKAFDDTESSDKDLEILNNKAVQRFLKEFENDLLQGKSEEEAVKDFLDKINEEIKRSMAHKRDAIVLAFQELKKNIHSYKIQSPNMPSSQAPPQLIAGGAVGGPVGGTFGAVGGDFGELTRGFHLGDQLKRKFPISQYKVNCWISFLEDQLKKLHQGCKRLLREEKDAALTDIKRKLENSEHEISAEIVALCDQSHILNKQLAQLEIVCNRMQTTIEGFDKLLAQ